MLWPYPTAPAWHLEKEAGLLRQEAWHGSASPPLQEGTGKPEAQNEPLSPALPHTETSSLLVSWEHRDYRICEGNRWCKIFRHHWPPPFSVSSVILLSFLLPNLQTRRDCQGTLWCSLEHGSWHGEVDSVWLIQLHSVEVH